MDGFRSIPKPMFRREREKINGWIHKHSQIHFRREGEELNGWIHKHSQSHVQERRKGVKWIDSQALLNPCSGKKGEIIDGFIRTLKPYSGEKE
jgi:hypothetical protein